MKKQIIVLLTTVFFTTNIIALNVLHLAAGVTQHTNPIVSFTENKGQVHDQNNRPRPDVLYGAVAGNLVLHIKTKGLSYQLVEGNSLGEPALLPFEKNEPRAKQKLNQNADQTFYRIDLNWVNNNTNFTQTNGEELSGFNNYYLDNCPNGVLNVKSYRSIMLNNLYNGIDLHYYEKNNELKHDYIVAPHADYKQIRLRVEGADISLNGDGSLLLSCPLGKVQEGAPIVYQNSKQLKARWQIINQTLGFEIDNYNPNYELIIDPVTRLWGTYYGGSAYDHGLSCSTDASGNVYLAGYTSSSTGSVIATSGSHKSTFGGNWDAYLAKFSPNGSRLWSTYYGGAGEDFAQSCATDASGNVYFTGETSTSLAGNAIATVGSHQQQFNGGFVMNFDAFLVKFNSNGVRQWGTYYGGSDDDWGYCCATDASGNVFIAGYTESTLGAFTSNGCHQPVFGGWDKDAFLAKFNTNGVRQWGTYYGGNRDDYGYSCATDASGNVFLAGTTRSFTGTAIANPNSHQDVIAGTMYSDAFLVKFNTSGVRQWGTYYGGTGAEFGYSCATDPSGNVYLTGVTASIAGTAIATANSNQSVTATGGGYLVKFNNNGIRQWGTYNDAGYGLSSTTDGAGNVFLAGDASSNSGTFAINSYQNTNGGGSDAYLTKFSTNGVKQWETFYGDTGQDFAFSCDVDPFGNIYLAGQSTSSTGITMASFGSHQSVYGGGASDAFL